MKTPEFHTDVAVIGGGIAGLWLLARLRDAGYRVLLIEASALGAGQSLASQGIIHGGIKYTLGGGLSSASEALVTMPERWRECLRGTGEIDLTPTELLADYQHLIAGSGASRLAGFLASKALRGRVRRLAQSERPAVLAELGFRGTVYRLDEPVLATASLLAAVADAHGDALALGRATLEGSTGQLELTTAQERRVLVQAQRIVAAAGGGNGALSAVPMQRRPLHMVMVRSDQLSPLFGHFLGWSDKPRLTVTSHRDRAGRSVWYLGGELAETGVGRERSQQIDWARTELAALLPALDLTNAEFATLQIERAEGRDRTGHRPDGPVMVQNGAVLTVWPTKLALAPLLADAVLTRLREQRIEPVASDALPPDWPRPPMADYPWDRRELQWN